MITSFIRGPRLLTISNNTVYREPTSYDESQTQQLGLGGVGVSGLRAWALGIASEDCGVGIDACLGCRIDLHEAPQLRTDSSC